jgi:protein-tyrosine phosphatase
MAKFRETGIVTIIDLRSDWEVEREPDAYPVDMGITRIHSSIGSMDQSGMMEFMTALADPNFNEEKADELMIKANLGFANSLADFKPIFDQMLEGEAILFHCSAGKDRTGLASAMILHILGADMETIKADFLRSNENIPKREANAGSAWGIPDDKIGLLAGVKEPYLFAALSAIEEKYGSLGKALEQEIGLTDEKIQVIRKLYLE